MKQQPAVRRAVAVVLRINFQGTDITVPRRCISWLKWSYKKIIAVIYDWPGARNLSLAEQSGHLKSLKFHVGIPRLEPLFFARSDHRHFCLFVLRKSRPALRTHARNPVSHKSCPKSSSIQTGHKIVLMATLPFFKSN